jgi:hypothetical protein
MTTVATRESPPQRRSGAAATLEGLAPLAGNLEHAAAAIARLDTLLTGHPLAAAWGGAAASTRSAASPQPTGG